MFILRINPHVDDALQYLAQIHCSSLKPLPFCHHHQIILLLFSIIHIHNPHIWPLYIFSYLPGKHSLIDLSTDFSFSFFNFYVFLTKIICLWLSKVRFLVLNLCNNQTSFKYLYIYMCVCVCVCVCKYYHYLIQSLNMLFCCCVFWFPGSIIVFLVFILIC